MKIHKVLLSFALVISFCSCQLMKSETSIYISTEGSDINPGTKQKPLKTLVAARDFVRFKRAAKPKLRDQEIKIILRKGSYVLDETLVLEPVDSNIIFKTYQDEIASIVGGRQINGWET